MKWKGLLDKRTGRPLTTLNCVINNDLGLKWVFSYNIKELMNLGIFALNFFQYFLHFYFGNRVFNLRPLPFCPKILLKINYMTNWETKTGLDSMVSYKLPNSIY